VIKVANEVYRLPKDIIINGIAGKSKAGKSIEKLFIFVLLKERWLFVRRE